MSGFQLTSAQRAAGVERIAENIALRSGAGCGKTFVLALRFTELLLHSGGKESPLRRIAAVTFTEKAALEMQQRVRRFLSERAAAAKGPDRRKLLEWIDELPDARISTIHGFCAALLRRHAIEAGVDPGFAVLADTLLADRLRREAADDALLAAIEAGRQDAAVLLGRMSYDRAVRMVDGLLATRTAWRAEDYADAEAILSRWRANQAEARRAAVAELPAEESVRTLREMAGPAGDAMEANRRTALAAIDAIAEDPEAPATAEAVRAACGISMRGGSKKKWGEENFARVKEAISALRDRLKAAAALFAPLGDLDAAAAETLVTLTSITAAARELYDADKRTRGLLDFDDLLAGAARLLEASPSARKALRESIDQLLIDEAQDTDPFQIDLLVRMVFGEDAAAAPPAGRLFLVGDGKQSIYRFRGARVEHFEALCARLGEAQREDLDLSFRTHAGGVEFVNALFAPLLAGYTPIHAHRTRPPFAPSVELILAEGSFASAEEVSRAQAAAAARRIAEMIDGGEKLVWDRQAERWRAVKAGDIAILLDRMTTGLHYERELERCGVPYYVIAGAGFFRQQEVFDVLNVLRAVDTPEDEVALAGVLRGGIFGIDDNALARLLAAAPGPRRAMLAGWGEADYRSAGLTEAQAAIAARCMALLARLRARKDAVGIAELIETLLRATGYEAALLSQPGGKRRVGNVRRVMQLARDASAGGTALADFLAEMNEMVLDESRFEQAPTAGEEDDVVRILTIHKAKGLEFPVVFVPDLNRGRNFRPPDPLCRTDWGLTMRLAGEEDENERPVSYQLASAAEKADDEAEDLRRLYVAVTRHEDHLVLVGADCRNAKGESFVSGPSGGSDNHLNRIDGVLGILSAADAGQEEVSYGDGRRMRLRTLSSAEPTAARRGETAPGRKLLAKAGDGEQLAAGLLKLGGEPPKLVGPLPVACGRAELAVTALGDFAACPALYRWRYELRVPRLSAAPGSPGKTKALPDAATMGTVYHRCMELLDFATPQPPEALVQQVLGELELEGSTDAGAAAEELAGMLETFRGHPLAAELAAAEEVYRELDFVFECGPAELRGQIDLLYRTADGRWRIVDWKSDCVGEEGTAPHAERYALQMRVYADAAEGFLAAEPHSVDATLYFLRTGQTHTFDAATPAPPHDPAELAARLVAARRSGSFRRNEGKQCRYCEHRRLCDGGGQ